MTQPTFWNPLTLNTNAWWQALSAPWQAQTAYWQTVQTLMQQRLKTLQGMGEMTQLACQGFQQCRNPAEVAAILAAWWGTQTKSLALLSADTQSAQQHLWEQWQKSFPLLDKRVWTQQYNAWQQACKSVMGRAHSSSSASSPSSGTPQTTASAYVQPRGTFTRGGGQRVAVSSPTTPAYAGPTVPGSAARGASKTTETPLPLVNTETVKQAVKAVKAPARTAMVDTVISPVSNVTVHKLQVPQELLLENLTGEAENVTSLSSSRTRMAAAPHANLAAAASTRRSVAARRVSKGRR